MHGAKASGRISGDAIPNASRTQQGDLRQALQMQDVHVDAVNPVTGTSWKLWFFQIHICLSNSITMR